MPHQRSRQAEEKRRLSWLSYLDFLRRRALNTSFFDKELCETVATANTTYYPSIEVGEVLADSRGRGTFQRRI